LKNKSEITFADEEIKNSYESDLKGNYQEKNIKTVIQTIKRLRLNGYEISENHIREGLLKVISNTGLMGRWQILQSHPKIVCDTAHNKEGLTYVMKQVLSETYEVLHVVFGVVNDKDLDTIIPSLPKKAIYYFCKPEIPRGLDAHELKLVLNSEGLVGEAYNPVKEAFMTARDAAKSTDRSEEHTSELQSRENLVC